MSRRVLFPLFGLTLAGTLVFAAEGGSNARQMLRARLAEEAKSGKPAIPTAEPPKSETAKAIAEASAPKEEPATPPAANAEPEVDPRKQVPTVLPQVDVRKERITELDVALAKQDKAIAREKEVARSSDLDRKINSADVAKPLALFGGESSQFRQQVSQGRIRLMEDEKDLMEAIAQARTREEKAALKKQLAELRAQRRELERALR